MTPADPGQPEYSEVAKVLRRLLQAISSEEDESLTAPRAVRYRLQGAALAFELVASGGPVDADELLASFRLTE